MFVWLAWMLKSCTDNIWLAGTNSFEWGLWISWLCYLPLLIESFAFIYLFNHYCWLHKVNQTSGHYTPCYFLFLMYYKNQYQMFEREWIRILENILLKPVDCWILARGRILQNTHSKLSDIKVWIVLFF